MQEVTDVPKKKVHKEIKKFILGGSTRIEAEEQDDGNWTIRYN